jgi:hypothetical protein
LARSIFEHFATTTAATTADSLDTIVGLIAIRANDMVGTVIEDRLVALNILPLYLSRSPSPLLDTSATLRYIDVLLISPPMIALDENPKGDVLKSILEVIRSKNLPVLHSIEQRLSEFILRSQPVVMDVDMKAMDEVAIEGVIISGRNEMRFLMDDLVRRCSRVFYSHSTHIIRIDTSECLRSRCIEYEVCGCSNYIFGQESDRESGLKRCGYAILRRNDSSIDYKTKSSRSSTGFDRSRGICVF